MAQNMTHPQSMAQPRNILRDIEASLCSMRVSKAAVHTGSQRDWEIVAACVLVLPKVG